MARKSREALLLVLQILAYLAILWGLPALMLLLFQWLEGR